jgi:CRISPR/Cas system-associated exonuclease Cas4 (RecB family)
MPGIDQFVTTVQGIDGVWPNLPSAWSYTSLRDAEECPRRWGLSRANYPSLWAQHGYPPRPILPALVGDVMHRVLELILRGLHDQGCESLADPCAVETLKKLGGYSDLTTRVIDEHLVPLEANPRIAGRIAGIRTALLARVPDIRQRVQTVIARTELRPAALVEREAQDAHVRGPLVDGSHPEVELRAPDLRFVGRADLVTIDQGSCSITDYKTGARHQHHPDQVKTYALLWHRDTELNPTNIPVKHLVLSYATHDEQVDPPTEPELDALARELSSRITNAETELQIRPPPARPAMSMCRLCSVRHLCEDYWSGPAASALSGLQTHGIDFVDCEAIVISQNGPRSWIVELDSTGASALLRSPTETPGFSVGDRVRLLDLAHAQDDDTSRLSLTMTQASEVYMMRRQP